MSIGEPRPPGPFDAVLCDLDGVLRHWHPEEMARVDRSFGLPEGTLATAVFRPDRLHDAVTGVITDEQWRTAIADDLTPACHTLQRARAAVADWSALTGTVDTEVLGLLTAVRRHVPIALVTNQTTRLEADLRRLGLTDVFDAVLNSAWEGVAKPDARLVLRAAARLGVPPERCLFVDDTRRHVETARATGMHALHYTRPSQLRETLGVLVS